MGITQRERFCCLGLGYLVVCVACSVAGCGSGSPIVQDLSKGVAITQDSGESSHEELVAKVTTATQRMSQPGLAAAVGGARVKLLKSGVHRVLLPLPQLADGQVPLWYHIHSTPADAALEFRLQRREAANDVVSVQLKGERNQEVQLHWSSVVLVAEKMVSPNPADPVSYRAATACVQATADEVKKLADQLWPESASAQQYAANIQQFVREMKRVKQPRSLDAVGILESGANGICTANANLALALLRTKGIAARSMAVIPPIAQRLEMHRTVEYFDGGRWAAFDPSSLHADVPMQPWQSVIMAKTTISDEDVAMKPRMGTSVGCPYAQELELLTGGITLWGQDFFWTMAAPLSEFQADDTAISLASAEWKRFLQEGTLSPGQTAARKATNPREFRELLQSN